jgi:uncharacterized metal-binding protein YceD (DUF177 family)
MTPEFSRPVRVDTLGTAPRELSIGADAAERDAIAARFGLLAVDRLAADLSIARHGDAVTVTGTLKAVVTQSCIATGEPVPAKLAEPFAILFRPHPDTAADEEIELSEGELDVTFYDGASIDLGEAVAETLSLSLDPYPRCADAEAALKAAGVLSEEQAKPASPLAGLKDLLTKPN